MNYQQIKALKNLIKEIQPWNRIRLGIKIPGSGSSNIHCFSLEPGSVITGAPETLQTWGCNIELPKVPLDHLYIRARLEERWLPLFNKDGIIKVDILPKSTCLRYHLELDDIPLMEMGDLVLNKEGVIIGYLFETVSNKEDDEDAYLVCIPLKESISASDIMGHLSQISATSAKVIRLL